MKREAAPTYVPRGSERTFLHLRQQVMMMMLMMMMTMMMNE